MTDVVLETRNLVKHFKGGIRAVDGIDLQLRRGETLGVVGESGCGKSTLAKLLVGLETPTSGSVTVRGQDMTRLRGGEMRRGLDGRVRRRQGSGFWGHGVVHK